MRGISRKKLLGYGLAIMATIFWGFHPVVIRHLTSQGVNPFTVAGLRLYIGTVCLALIVLISHRIRGEVIPKGRYNLFFWMTGIGLALNFLLFHKGLQYTTASDAILLETFAPAVVLVMAVLFVPHRIRHLLNRPHALRALLLIVIAGSIGTSLLLINEPADLLLGNVANGGKLWGDLLEFGAMFCFALFLLGSHEYRQQSSNESPLLNSARFLFVAALVLTPFIAWSELAALTQRQWAWILILGIFSTSVTYTLWHHASKYIDVIPLAVIFSLTSVFNVALESIVFKLELSPKLLLGAFLIIAAAIGAEVLNVRLKVMDEDSIGEQ